MTSVVARPTSAKGALGTQKSAKNSKPAQVAVQQI